MADTPREQLADLRTELDAADTGNAIPYARFQRLLSQFRRLEEMVTNAERAENEELTQLRAQLEEANTKLGTLQQERDTLAGERDSWSQEREIMSAGITDPEGLEFARLAWQRMAEDQRPEGGLSAWLQARDGLPKAVQAYLPPAGDQPAQQQAPAQQGARVPDPNAGARTYTQAPRTPDVPQDLEQYRAQRDQLFGGKAPTYPWQRGKDS